MTAIITAAIGLVGLGLGFFIRSTIATSKAKKAIESAEKEVQKILEEAQQKARKLKEKKEIESKKYLLSLKNKQDHSYQDRINQLKQREAQFRQKQENINRQQSELDNQQLSIKTKRSALAQKEEDVLEETRKVQDLLEKISGMNKEDAQKALLETVKQEAKAKAFSLEQAIIDEAKVNASKEARKIVIQTIQRTASEQVIENAVSIFHLESNDVKGQIIGREGRNIRAIEAATGVELNIDNTPEAIMISSFDPFRREVARLSLQRLVTDGRIHPGRIEEVVAKTLKQMEEQVMEIGQRTIVDLGIVGMHKELIRMVGKMRFRSSYGQNLLMHSREVANLCSIMSVELQLNPKLAKRAGLLHDIGKVPDNEKDAETPHALLGMQLAERYGESETVCNAIGAHHDEIPMKYVISPIIQACDAISGARPGARREVFESYIKRLKDLEEIALSQDAVEKAYAIQAGRELRVIVQNEKIKDQEIDHLSHTIASTIQDKLTYPGQVKVIVIRESRATSIAK